MMLRRGGDRHVGKARGVAFAEPLVGEPAGDVERQDPGGVEVQ
jgi:hypothetical protein